MKNLNTIIKAIILLVGLATVLASCSPNNKMAQQSLNQARALYKQGYYKKSIATIDSLNKQYPKAIAERKASLLLLDSVRRADNIQNIQFCDSIVALRTKDAVPLANTFTFEKNEKYQKEGYYLPKELADKNEFSQSNLRCGVENNGSFFIESVFTGKAKHNKLKASLKDGSFCETNEVNEDGFNYSFSNRGKTFEIIRFTDKKENGVARFIFANQNQPITITLSGINNAKDSYLLPVQTAKAVARSYQLAKVLSEIDSLKEDKEKSQYKIRFLEKRITKQAQKQN